MAVINQDRGPLDDALQDPTTTLLILSGEQDSEAKAVDDLAEEGITEPWRKTFLLLDLSVLSETEKEKWVSSFPAEGLRSSKSGALLPKVTRHDWPDMSFNSPAPASLHFLRHHIQVH
jgi:hypothetical protein